MSTGSACHADQIEPSHVLQAIQVPDNFIKGTLRITLNGTTTQAMLDETIQAIHDIYSSL